MAITDGCICQFEDPAHPRGDQLIIDPRCVKHGYLYKGMYEKIDMSKLIQSPLPSKQLKIDLTKKENGMNYTTIDSEVRAELEKRAAEAALAKKMGLIDAYGVDLYEDGTVLKFEKKFLDTPDATAYTYVALKSNGTWWTSGSNGGGVHGGDWDKLVFFLISGPSPTAAADVQIAVEWTANFDDDVE